MEINDFEKELVGLAGEARKAGPPDGLIPATLLSLRTRQKAGVAISWKTLSPVFLTLLLLAAYISFASFTSEPLLDTTKIVLLIISLAMGSAFIFDPKMMARIDKKMLGSRLARIGPAATPFQEIVLFRVQGIYLFLLALFICKL